MYNRRRFIKTIMGLISALGLLFNPLARWVRVALAKAKRVLLPGGTKMDSLIHRNPARLDTRNLALTPMEKFDTMGQTDHHVDLNKWRLEIDGEVEHPVKFSRDQILQMPAIEKEVLLICPGVFAYHARWKGISAARLLETAGVKETATHVVFSGPRGTYKQDRRFPIADIRNDKVFLAYGVNSVDLPVKHGFPLRVVAQDEYGSDWVKYVYRVTAFKA
jgi:sulfoxide reductase catalytic subunit YedY